MESLFAQMEEPFAQTDGSVIVNVCAGCDRRFRTLYNGISTISLWEALVALDNFPFPDYHGMEVSVHDPCPVRNAPAVHRAVRELLKRMNIRVREAEKKRRKRRLLRGQPVSELQRGEDPRGHEGAGGQHAVREGRRVLRVLH